MKKIAICKNDILSPNFKKDKIYYYEYNDGYFVMKDDFSIVFTFDEKRQNSFQEFFNFKFRGILFDSMFYNISESRRIKLNKILN